MNKGVNLLRIRQYNFNVPSDRLGKLRIFAIGLLFSVSVIAIIVLILVVLSPLPQLRRQEQSAIFTLSQFHKDIAKFLFVHNRTDSIAVVFSKKENYSQTIEDLRTKIPNGVEIREFNIKKDDISLTFSSKSLKLLDVLIISLVKFVEEKKQFSKIVVKDMSTQGDTGEFILSLHLSNL